MAETETSKAPAATRREDVIRYRTVRKEEVCPPPKRHHESDTGWDLAACIYSVVAPRMRSQIPHNMAIEIPEGHFGLILPRASTLHNRGLLVQTSIIDEGYRGELFTMVINLSDRMVHVNEGEHLSQLVILPRVKFEFLQVKERQSLSKGERGDSGFGSTGA